MLRSFAPWRSAAARKKANTIEAGALIVIEVVTCSSGIASKSASMSCREAIATPHLPTSPSESG